MTSLLSAPVPCTATCVIADWPSGRTSDPDIVSPDPDIVSPPVHRRSEPSIDAQEMPRQNLVTVRHRGTLTLAAFVGARRKGSGSGRSTHRLDRKFDREQGA